MNNGKPINTYHRGSWEEFLTNFDLDEDKFVDEYTNQQLLMIYDSWKEHIFDIYEEIVNRAGLSDEWENIDPDYAEFAEDIVNRAVEILKNEE